MSTEDAVQQLESYILDPDPFQSYAIPKRLQRDVVARFIVSRIGRETGFTSLVRMENVVTFYDLQEVCGHLLSLLPANPTPADVANAAVISRTIAATCLPADVQKAAAYYPALISRAANSSAVAELLQLQDRLGPTVDSASLEAQIERLRSMAASRKQTDREAGNEEAILNEMRSLRLGRVRSANKIKADVLAMPDRQQRIQQEIKMYLTLEYGYLEFLTPWAAARLRRETWGDSPAGQMTRNENDGRRAEIARIFESVAANIDRLPEVPPENRDSLRVRCLRAAVYFGSRLEPQEQIWLTQKAGAQVDILSID